MEEQLPSQESHQQQLRYTSSLKMRHIQTQIQISQQRVQQHGAAAEYSVEIPAQDAAQTFSSFLLYVTTLDQAVTLTNVTVTAN